MWRIGKKCSQGLANDRRIAMRTIVIVKIPHKKDILRTFFTFIVDGDIPLPTVDDYIYHPDMPWVGHRIHHRLFRYHDDICEVTIVLEEE